MGGLIAGATSLGVASRAAQQLKAYSAMVQYTHVADYGLWSPGYAPGLVPKVPKSTRPAKAFGRRLAWRLGNRKRACQIAAEPGSLVQTSQDTSSTKFRIADPAHRNVASAVSCRRVDTTNCANCASAPLYSSRAA